MFVGPVRHERYNRKTKKSDLTYDGLLKAMNILKKTHPHYFPELNDSACIVSLSRCYHHLNNNLCKAFTRFTSKTGTRCR